ncbi:MAG: hypothetical protein JXX29_12055 [Deltaproteobacteria bacterium]|nr:hypothetical protein [Deltaproteobacteria bacterium]MBN2672406.1 hypothetical protein [Deltaproteobacteria bacterium]
MDCVCGNSIPALFVYSVMRDDTQGTTADSIPTGHRWVFRHKKQIGAAFGYVVIYTALVLFCKEWFFDFTVGSYLASLFVLFIYLPLLLLGGLGVAARLIFQKRWLPTLYAVLLLGFSVGAFWLTPNRWAFLTARHFAQNPAQVKAQVLSSASDATRSNAVYREYAPVHFNWPIVFVSDDHPENVYDTCGMGGKVVMQLEPNWYICHRDWN